MSPDRTGGKRVGNYRIDRVFPGVGRVRLTSGVRTLKEFHRRNDTLTRLYEDGRLDLLEALRDRRLTMAEVYAAARGRAPVSLAAVALVAPLWARVTATLPKMGASEETRRRYQQSLDKLQGLGVLGATARLRDLGRVDWRGRVRPAFGGASDWMKLRAAVSRFLVLELGDERHPLRLQVIQAMGRERAPERTPDVSVAAFWRAHATLPRWAKDPILTIVGLGLRSGEYVDADEKSLRPHARQLVVSGKTGPRVVEVPEALWAVVAAAVPARYARARQPGERVSATPRYQRLAKAWKRACDRAGIECTLHDCRHLLAQIAADLGEGDAAIGDALGHATGSASVTRRYTKRRARKQVTERVAKTLLQEAS